MERKPVIEMFLYEPPCPKCKEVTRLCLALSERGEVEVRNYTLQLDEDATVRNMRFLINAERYGLVSLPALVLNGRVAFSSRAPTEGELLSAIKKARPESRR